MQKRAGCEGLRRSVVVRSYPSPEVRSSNRERQAATAQERRPRGASLPEVRGPAREELSHLQGVAPVWVQEGREELFHVQGQEAQL